MAMVSRIIQHSANNILLKINLFSYPVSFRADSSCSGDDEGGKKVPPSGSKPGEPTIYETRKYGHKLPLNNVCPNFELLNDIPSGIFRCTTGECLGIGASKTGCYRNPEFFSYHHMSWFDLHLHLRKYRQVSPDTMRKPP